MANIWSLVLLTYLKELRLFLLVVIATTALLWLRLRVLRSEVQEIMSQDESIFHVNDEPTQATIDLEARP